MQKPSAEISNFYYFCVRKLVNVCLFAYLAIATHTNVHDTTLFLPLCSCSLGAGSSVYVTLQQWRALTEGLTAILMVSWEQAGIAPSQELNSRMPTRLHNMSLSPGIQYPGSATLCKLPISKTWSCNAKTYTYK